MKDKFLLGISGGATGAAAMVLLNRLFNLIPGVHTELIFGVSKLFVPQQLLGTLPGATIGVIAHLICGSIVGLGFVYILELTGYDYLLAKGAILGLMTWFLMCGLVGRLLKLGMQDKLVDNLLMIAVHIVFGVTTMVAISYLRKKALAGD